jgi:hypothetical protein
MTPDESAEIYLANEQMWGDLAQPTAPRQVRGFELTVYANPGKPFKFKFMAPWNGKGPRKPDDVINEDIQFITFTEDDLQRGILDGTLTHGIFNGYRTKPGRLSTWPEKYWGLKYDEEPGDWRQYNEDF